MDSGPAGGFGSPADGLDRRGGDGSTRRDVKGMLMEGGAFLRQKHLRIYNRLTFVNTMAQVFLPRGIVARYKPSPPSPPHKTATTTRGSPGRTHIQPPGDGVSRPSESVAAPPPPAAPPHPTRRGAAWRNAHGWGRHQESARRAGGERPHRRQRVRLRPASAPGRASRPPAAPPPPTRRGATRMDGDATRSQSGGLAASARIAASASGEPARASAL